MLTVGKALGTILAIIIAIGICGLGWVALKYQAASGYPLAVTPQNGADMLAAFKDAPPLICNGTQSGFNNPASGVVHVLDGAIAISMYYPTNDNTVRMLIDDSGWYLWPEGALDVTKLPLDQQIPSSDSLSTFSSFKCNPWWSPDSSIMQVPAAAIVHTPR
ncbi:MAG: hypothetical protein JO019_02470 [Candidatus Kaiserbacteria bacterium]|nr:hypothetical protein [Candidatus Kaiserbacteria bacterium]